MCHIGVAAICLSCWCKERLLNSCIIVSRMWKIVYRRMQHLPVIKLAEFNGRIVINRNRFWVRPEYRRLRLVGLACGCIYWSATSVSKALWSCARGTLITMFQKPSYLHFNPTGCNFMTIHSIKMRDDRPHLCGEMACCVQEWEILCWEMGNTGAFAAGVVTHDNPVLQLQLARSACPSACVDGWSLHIMPEQGLSGWGPIALWEGTGARTLSVMCCLSLPHLDTNIVLLHSAEWMIKLPCATETRSRLVITANVLCPVMMLLGSVDISQWLYDPSFMKLCCSVHSPIPVFQHGLIYSPSYSYSRLQAVVLK